VLDRLSRGRFRRRPRHEWALLLAHIPKTAGSSLRNALSQLYRPQEQLFLYDASALEGAVHPTRFGELPLEERAGLRFISGHFQFGLHELVPRESRYLTAVRDPVDRVASLYYHYRRVADIHADTRAGAEGRLILDQGLSLDDWGFGLQRIEIDNEMVRYMSGRRDVPFGGCTDDMLDDALQHVDHYAVSVMVMERMDESVRDLQDVLGARLPQVDRLNANAERRPLADIDAGVASKIRELNQLDEAFYHAMEERLDKMSSRGSGRIR
jgi:hypothetical protein